jgi:UDP-N-acetylglucosamine 2-epimerase (non-hydrolysing)
MKIMTILGTRPEIIRLSCIIPKLDKFCEHVIVHTGQNYDNTLNDIFFKELAIRTPNYILECKSDSLMMQISKILVECEKVMIKEKPDRLLILGDTNSALSAMVAKRMNIPVYHMEAGNRCYDDRVPEEVNRRIIDHCSDILLPYTERSRTNLLREGIESKSIFVTGNPIKEVLDYYTPQIKTSDVLNRLDLQAGKYFLVTLHRAENVDVPERLIRFVSALHKLHSEFGIPIICSLHPRTRSQLEKQSLILEDKGVWAMNPLGLFDFVNLEMHAKCVLTDSGTVQEECCIFKIPTVTLRDVTERPETVEVGSNILSGAEPESILNCVKVSLMQKQKWDPPKEYLVENISQTVVKIVLGYLH